MKKLAGILAALALGVGAGLAAASRPLLAQTEPNEMQMANPTPVNPGLGVDTGDAGSLAPYQATQPQTRPQTQPTQPVPPTTSQPGMPQAQPNLAAPAQQNPAYGH